MAKDPSKTEKATSRRRKKAREEGEVVKSVEVTAFLTFTGIFMVLLFFGDWTLGRLQNVIRFFYSRESFHITESEFNNIVWDSEYKFLIVILPFLLTILIMVFLGSFAQFGWLFTTKPLEPKFGKLDPIKGLKNQMLSLKTLAELVKTVLKVAVISYVCYKAIAPFMLDLPPLSDMSLPYILSVLFQILTRVFTYTAIVLIVLAIADWAFQKYQYEEKLKMSKQEVKEEMKDIEGNPEIKKRRYQKMFEMSRKRMMAAVPTADVVVTNPTHFAVALKYEQGMHSPKVVAKGQGYIALKIKEIAAKSGVPAVEDKPLARALFKMVEVDNYIPEKLFKAVAEVLAYVYKLNKRVG
jgi:flagellar biosynthetic protein FlhB